MTTPKLLLPELSPGQAGKELTHNAALARLDQAVNSTVLDKDLSTPPGSPIDGAGYIVAASPTGAWAGKANNIAFWRTSAAAWDFIAPFNGLSTWVEDEAKRYEYKAGAWAEFSAGASSGAVVDFSVDRTLGLTDVNTYLRCTSATDKTITIAPQSSVAWAANTELRVQQGASGGVNIAPGAGVTINKPPASYAKTRFLNGVVTLKRTASDVWTMYGDIAPIVTNCGFRGTAKSSGNSTTITVNKPTGTVDGDIIVVAIMQSANSTISLAGWTERTTTLFASSTRYSIFTKTASSEGASWSFTATASGQYSIMAATISGGTAFDVNGTLPGATSSGPSTAASVTMTGAGIIVAVSFNGQNPSVLSSSPTGMTTIDTITNSFTGITMAYEIVPAGATGTRSTVWTGYSGQTAALIGIK